MTTVTAFKPLTKHDIAEVLGVSTKTIENWVNEGTLPAPRRIGNRVYWHPNVFYGWLENRLNAEDVSEGTSSVAGQSDVKVPVKNPTFQAKLPVTEAGKLRSRDQAKLDAMLS